jgi:hypothetical protein
MAAGNLKNYGIQHDYHIIYKICILKKKTILQSIERIDILKKLRGAVVIRIK